MLRFFIVLIAFMSTTDYKLCNAAIHREDTVMACFEESDEETLIDVTPKLKSIALSSIVKDKRVLAYLSAGERIKRAVAAAKQIGCPPSVMLAQDGIESGWGSSDLVGKTKNSGNLKCRCNTNRALRRKHAYLASTGNEVCVRGYDKIEKSNDYYMKFKTSKDAWDKKVKTLQRYKVVKRAKPGLPAEQWCGILCKSPYATDKSYGDKLKKVIWDNNLKSLDDFISKDYSITSESGIYTFYGPDEPQYVNWVTFPDQDDFFESAEHRKAKRQKWAEYIKAHKAYALAAQKKYQVPASILLAEGLILSNCGQLGDHFQTGIKFGSVKDAYMSHARAIGPQVSYMEYARKSNLSNKLIHVIEDMEIYNYDREYRKSN